MTFTGLLIGMATFIIIGLFHPLVIWAEYHFGVKFWYIFLIFGIITITISLIIKNLIISSLLGVFGFSCLWSIKEIFEQVKRVEQGRFPKNPKRMKPGSN